MKDVREDDMVEGEMLGEKEFDVFVEDIDRNYERCRIGDNSIHCLVRWPINMLVDNEGEILRVNENFKEAPKEIAVWDLIEDTSPLNTWDDDLYNEEDLESIAMHATRPYKMIKRVVATKKVGNFQIQRDEEKEI